jgi:hypothetical protein
MTKKIIGLVSIVACTLFSLSAIPISIFVPTNADPTQWDAVGTTVTVDSSKIYTFSRMYMQPAGGDKINFAPYYYAVKVQWATGDGQPILVNGAPFFTEVYAAIIFDNNLQTWRDVSGVALSNYQGITRFWQYETAYFSCSSSYSGMRFLQAFRAGSAPFSVLYDQVKVGADVLPALQPVTSFDEVILANPSYGAQWYIYTRPGQISSIAAQDVLLNTQAVASTGTCPNTLQSAQLAPISGGALVTFTSAGSAVNYSVPLSDMYQVVNYMPATRPRVTQQILVVPITPLYSAAQAVATAAAPAGHTVSSGATQTVAPATQSASAASTAAAPSTTSPAKSGVAAAAPAGAAAPAQALPECFAIDKQFASAQLGFVLAQYYVKMGSYFIAVTPALDIAGAVIPNSFVAWQGSINAQNIQSPASVGTVQTSVVLSSDQTNCVITGYPYFADAAQGEGNCYFGNQPVLIDGVPTGFVVAAHEYFFWGRIPVNQQQFQGQVPFYMTSLDMLQSITKEEIAASSYRLYPLALLLATQRQIAKVPAEDNYLPVSFKTIDQKVFNGMIVFKTDLFPAGQDASSFKSPPSYYVSVPVDGKMQMWFSPDNTLTLQIANDFTGSVITELSMISLTDYQAWPAGLSDKFKAVSQSFVGTQPPAPVVMKTKTPGFFDRIAAVFKPSAVKYEKAPVKS